MSSVVGRPMVQDTPVQDIPIPVQEQFLSRTNSKPEMGAAAAYDTSPPPLHQNPPIMAESAQPSALDMAQLLAWVERMENKLKEEMREKRGEMRQVGQCLQAGKMATPRVATNELEGSAPAGEDRVIRETCRVTEKVTETVTVREKLNGVTETCTAGRQVTELTETREVEERLQSKDGVVGRTHTHTHTRTHTHAGSEGQWG